MAIVLICSIVMGIVIVITTSIAENIHHSKDVMTAKTIIVMS